MKKITGLFSFLLFGFPLTLTAQIDTISQRIVLVGDAGELTNGKHPVVEAIKQYIKLDKKTTVLYLGDNLYDTGLPDEESLTYQAAKAVLDSQLSVAENSQSRVLMIPGNHDWKNGGRDGYASIIREQLYVDLLNKPNVQFYPKDGCPGPIEVSLGSDVTLVIFDSQWWIHPYEKPGIESDCDSKTNEELLTQIEDIVTRNSKKLVLLACHHPFKSNSVHGGFFQLKHHIFPLTDIKRNLYIPLPVLGSIYPIARSVFGTPQDLSHPNYANMINQVTNAVKSHPHVVFVAGHDHGLQMIQDSNYNYIVSGGGCKINRVSQGKNSLYAESYRGFAVMEISTNKNVTVSFYTVTDSVRNPFGTTLLNFSSLPEPTGDSAKREVDAPANIKYKDTFTVSASDRFPPIHGLKKFVIGQNYRHEWTTPVNMKVFNLTKEQGGFTIQSLGGGKQTRSLRLKNNKTGKEWVLRAVEKLPTAAMPAEFRGTLAEDLVMEFNSASHPYAPLTIPELAKPLSIAVPQPQLFFVPDDPALGFYQALFANRVCMLEERDPSFDGTDTRSTAKVFDKLVDENDHRADQLTVLRARLLDILIGDFDRHFDQWKWSTSDTGKGKLYYPIPRDRDQAFFYSDGQLLKSTSKSLLPFLGGFRKDISQVNWFNWAARDFDRLFLTDLDEDEWKKTITEVQGKLNDSVITKAIRKLPAEIYPISGKTLADKLISRRNGLPVAALTYYKFISKGVNVVGSNQKEYFKVSNHGHGLQVRVYAREGGSDTSFIMYDRIFDPSITREIRLYGLNNNDLFEIDSNAASRIKFRIIGGKGADTFNIKGKVEALIYDMNVEGNYIKNNSHTKNRFSKDPPVNSYSILGFKYNKTSFPQIRIGANPDDGLMLGAGFSQRTYGFRNEPYATDQKLFAFASLSRGAYRVRYDGEFNHITRDVDLIIKSEIAFPEVNNFFGLGNTTEMEEEADYGFYRTRFKAIEVNPMIRHRFFERLQVMAGPYFFHYWNDHLDNADKVLGKPSLVNLDSADIYSKKTYLGAKFAMNFDNRNNEVFPTRGVLWETEFVSTAGLSQSSDPYTKLTSDMTIYASLSDPARLTAVVTMGGGKIFSKSFEYFQAMAIGNSNTLHGFRKNRYTGKSSLYGSMELRLKLLQVKSYLFPGPLGLTGFYDIGRVWLPGEDSK
ncbi:MAG TPA: BamA/TamA family outer membrane protein, partial [Chitinophagaceae bacterium]|nr:BamA/TamA family outer membrane protein [Chitinophagaceae bacterium]